MGNISMLVTRINAFVDEYYKEQQLIDSDPKAAVYHMHKMDRLSEHILGIRDAINLLGYEVTFSDNLYPFGHVSAIVKIGEADASTSN